MSVQADILTPDLPWSTNSQQERKFRHILLVTLALLLLTMIIIPLVQVPELKRESAEKIPQQLARFIVEHQTVSSPKPAPSPVAAKPEEINKKKTQKKASAKKQDNPQNLEQPNAREVAQKHISSFSSSLAEISASVAIPQTLKVITTAGEKNKPVIYSGKQSTEKMSTRLHAGSGTLTIAKTNTIANPQALSSAPLQRASKKPGINTQGKEIKQNTATKKPEPNKRIRRSRENIQKVFDANKGAIYAIYNRALRSNPDLEGKVVFKLVINPDGTVSQCKISSSDLNAPKLEKKLVARIKLFNFGAIKNVEVWRDSFYLDFIPSE